MKKIPKLRFPEFSGEWEKVFLDNVTKRGTGHTPDKKKQEYYNGGIKWVSLGDSSRLDKGEIFETNTEISQKGIENSSAVIHPKGTVLLSRDAGVGKSAVMGCDMAVSQHFITWSMDGKMDNWFLYYYLQKEKKEFERIAVGSTIKTIGMPYFKSYQLYIPPINEQENIGQILYNVDSKIEKLERKKELWEQYKKGMMQKIFSQELRFQDENGEDYPEWEEKSLGEIGKTFNGLTGKTKEDFGSGKPYITYKSIFDSSKISLERVEYVNVKENENQNKVKFGDIFFTTSSETPKEVGMSSVLLDDIDNCYLNSFCFGFRLNDLSKVAPKFMQFYLRGRKIRDEISMLAQGSTRYNLSKSELMKLELTIPSLTEQTQIADFLSSIDSKIEMVEKELLGMKEFKKGLLQKMFV